MVNSLDALKSLGYIQMVQKGWIDLFSGGSETTRYKPEQYLIDLFDEYDLNYESVVKEADSTGDSGKRYHRTIGQDLPLITA